MRKINKTIASCNLEYLTNNAKAKEHHGPGHEDWEDYCIGTKQVPDALVKEVCAGYGIDAVNFRQCLLSMDVIEVLRGELSERESVMRKSLVELSKKYVDQLQLTIDGVQETLEKGKELALANE